MNIDLEQTQEFLRLLAPGESNFTFQVFPEAKSAPVFAKHMHGSLREHEDALISANQQGAGVFVMVNEGNGQGRKAADVVRVRALFVDLDGAPIDPLINCPSPPHIVVETSPQRWHAYWRTFCPLDRFCGAQRVLIDRFGGDKSIVDLPRVMRLPGFYHRKGSPWLVRLHSVGQKDELDGHR